MCIRDRLIYVLCSIITLPHLLCLLPTPIFCWFHVSIQPLPPVILALQPPQSGTHYSPIVLPLQTLSLASFNLTASSRPTAPPSGSAKCLRFGHWLTLCTVNIHSLTYLLTYFHWSLVFCVMSFSSLHDIFTDTLKQCLTEHFYGLL